MILSCGNKHYHACGDSTCNHFLVFELCKHRKSVRDSPLEPRIVHSGMDEAEPTCIYENAETHRVAFKFDGHQPSYEGKHTLHTLTLSLARARTHTHRQGKFI